MTNPDSPFSLGDVPSLDTDKLGGWEEPDDVCPEIAVCIINGSEFAVRCELGGAHDEHEAVLRWVTDDGATDE